MDMLTCQWRGCQVPVQGSLCEKHQQVYQEALTFQQQNPAVKRERSEGKENKQGAKKAKIGEELNYLELRGETILKPFDKKVHKSTQSEKEKGNAYTHLNVKMVESNFIAVSDIPEKIPILDYNPNGYFIKHFAQATGYHEFRSEDDIKSAIKDLISAMLRVGALQNQPLQMFSQYSIVPHLFTAQNIEGNHLKACDIALGSSDRVGGVVEAKCPFLEKQESPLTHHAVCAQMATYLYGLRVSTGRNALGLLTTYNSIRVCWLDNLVSARLATCTEEHQLPNCCNQPPCVCPLTLHCSKEINITENEYLPTLFSFLVKSLWASRLSVAVRNGSQVIILSKGQHLQLTRGKEVSDVSEGDQWCTIVQGTDNFEVLTWFSPGGDGYAMEVRRVLVKEEHCHPLKRNGFHRIIFKIFYKYTSHTEISKKQIQQEVEKFNHVNEHLPEAFHAFSMELNSQQVLVMPYCAPISMEKLVKMQSDLEKFVEHLWENHISYVDFKQDHFTFFEEKDTKFLCLIDTCRVKLTASEQDIKKSHDDFGRFIASLRR